MAEPLHRLVDGTAAAIATAVDTDIENEFDSLTDNQINTSNENCSPTTPKPIGVAVFGFSPFAACALRQIVSNTLSSATTNGSSNSNNLNRRQQRQLRLIGCWTSDDSERLALKRFLKRECNWPPPLLGSGDDATKADAVVHKDEDSFIVTAGGDPAVLAKKPEVSLLLLCCRGERVQVALSNLAKETGSLAIRLWPPPPPPHLVSETAAVGCSYRYLPSVQCMRSRLASGLIGQLQVININLRCSKLVGQRYDWTCDPDMGGGVLAFYGAIAIDLVHYLAPAAAAAAAASTITETGSFEVVRVSGRLLTCQPRFNQIDGIRCVGVDQVTSFDLQLAGDCWVHVWLDSLFNGYSHTVELIGELGRLTLSDFVLTHAEHGDSESHVLHTDPITESEQAILQSLLESADIPMRQFASPTLVKSVAGLIDSVARNDGIAVDYPAGNYWAQVQRTLAAIRCSNQLRRWVSLAECGAKQEFSVARLPTV